jgi:hypothetical protein
MLRSLLRPRRQIKVTRLLIVKRIEAHRADHFLDEGNDKDEPESKKADAAPTEGKPSADEEAGAEKKADEETAVASSAPEAATNGTPASAKKGKRKSNAGVPEHRAKKLNRKKSMNLVTHIDAQPGEYYFARLKGFPPWPAMICDEEMLPQVLLSSRPVTAKGPDGKYRDDFADGGKRQNERTFPVMFMETYEL